MTARCVLLAVVLAALLPLHAVAADRYVPIEKRVSAEQLATVGLTPEQLARLNALLRDADVRDAATAAPAPPGTASDAAERTSSTQYLGLDSKTITTKVRGSVAGWSPGTVFDLDNGQQWKVLKGTVTLRHALDAPTVRLVPGIAGRWFLEVDEDQPKARVYRID